jgi:hypothetical protein
MWQKILEGFIELYANDGECSPVVKYRSGLLCRDVRDICAHVERFQFLISGIRLDSEKRWARITVGQDSLDDGYEFWGQFPKCELVTAGLVPNFIFSSQYPPDWKKFRELARSATCNLTEEDYERAAISCRDGGDIQHWIAWLFYCCRGYKHLSICEESQCIKSPVKASIWAIKRIIDTQGVGTPEMPPDPLTAFMAVCLRQRDAVVGALAVDARRDQGEPEEIDPSGNVVNEGRPPAPARTAGLVQKAWQPFEDAFKRIEATIEERYLTTLLEAYKSHRQLLSDASELWQGFSDEIGQELHIQTFDALRDIRNARRQSQPPQTTKQTTTTPAPVGVAVPPVTPASPTPSLKWLADALLLRREHPDWSDAKIARSVGKDPGTLSRNKVYKSAATKLTQGSTTDRPKGFRTVNKKSGAVDVEAVAPESAPEDDKSDRGMQIPGSRFFREYCAECDEPMGVTKEKVGTDPACKDCE